jgi:hypothetical protein
MHIVLLNVGMKSTQEVERVLSGQGYENFTRRSPTVDESHALSAEVLITEATQAKLNDAPLGERLQKALQALSGGMI